MELAEASATKSNNPGGDKLADDPSVTSSLEHLVAGSQGVVTKRIDLALLEARELLSRTLQGGALVALGVVLAAAAWFAATASLVLLVIPEAGRVVHLAAFALVNGGCAAGLVALARRRGRSQTRARQKGDGSNTSA